MISEAPPFWWQRPDWRSWALWPASLVYGAVAGRRLRRGRREAMPLPVICVGNLTVGGTGKTPSAIALAEAAKTMGRRPGFLSRGHGGTVTHAHLVDLAHDTARHVGDEPLLLARHAPTAVAPVRAEGARLLRDQGCDLVIMDDGFQSAQLVFDFSLIVVDASRGIGNGHVIPGGPLRATLTVQLAHADALLVVGEGGAAAGVVRRAARAGRPVFEAAIVPSAPERLAGRRFLAFCGIGNPDKFFATIAAAGGAVADRRVFSDHHDYQDDELEELLTAAERGGLALVTTEKDAVRVRPGSAVSQAVVERLETVPIGLAFDPPGAPERIIAEAIAKFDKRRFEA